jgi:hypothetical protein
MHGDKSPRADIVDCGDEQAFFDNRDYVIVSESNSGNVSIVPDVYDQGES